MLKLLTAAILMLGLASGIAQAGMPGSVAPVDNAAHVSFMLGIAVEFGDTVDTPDVGITAKVLTSNKPNQFVLGAGVAYFPWAVDQFGIDVDAGFNFDNVTALVGYDLLRDKVQFSAGYSPTDGGQHCPPGFPDFNDIDGQCWQILP